MFVAQVPQYSPISSCGLFEVPSTIIIQELGICLQAAKLPQPPGKAPQGTWEQLDISSKLVGAPNAMLCRIAFHPWSFNIKDPPAFCQTCLYQSNTKIMSNRVNDHLGEGHLPRMKPTTRTLSCPGLEAVG